MGIMWRKHALAMLQLFVFMFSAILLSYTILSMSAPVPDLFKGMFWMLLSMIFTILVIKMPVGASTVTSLGEIIDLAAIAVVGPYPVLIANCLGVLIRSFKNRQTDHFRTLFNLSQLTLAGLITHYVMSPFLVGGNTQFDYLFVFAFMLGWISYSIISTSLVSMAISISENSEAYAVWKKNYLLDSAVSLTALPLAPVMAYLYIKYSFFPVVILCMPVFAISLVINYLANIERSNNYIARVNQLAEMGKAASAILHEISRPLNRIVMLSDFALKGGRAKDEALTQVLEEAHTASRISDKLLTSMRMNVARTEVYPDSLLEELKRLADTEGIPVFVTDNGSELREATFWDIDLVCTALLNLVRNGWESQNAEGDPPRIALSRNDSAGASRPGIQGGEPVFCYSVTDSGPGISPGMEKDIFEALYSTKRKGLGMGLFIAHQVALAHGGSLRARNCEQGGAEFVLELPIRRK